ncbi:MAG: DUF87 domain-containing protein [Synechococcus sp.]
MTTSETQKYVKVNPLLGYRPSLGPISGDLLLPWGIIGTANLFLFRMLLSSWELFVLFSLTGAAWHWLITGKQPWKFWGYAFYHLPKWTHAGNLPASLQQPIKLKLGKKVARKNPSSKQTTQLKAFQDAVDLLYVASLRLQDRRVGAYVLNKGKAGYQIVFEFDCLGVPSLLRDSEIELYLEKLATGLKDIPAGESLSFHLGSFSEYRDRIQELDRLLAEADPQIAFLLTSEKATVQQIATSGQRKPKFLRLYATYTVQPDGARRSDNWTDNLLRGLDSCWKQRSSQIDRARAIHLSVALTEAFEEGLQMWENLLKSKLGLNVAASDEDLLWQHLCQQFCLSDPPPLPQLLVLEEVAGGDRLRLVDADPLDPTHPLTALLARGIPFADRAYVKLTRDGRDVYKGGVIQTAKPAGWKRLDQLKAGSQLILRDDLHDIELFCQLTPANPQLIVTSTQEQLRHSNQLATYARKKDRKDVRADVKAEQAEEAQRRLIEGEIPLHVAVVYIVERPTLSQLDRTCRKLTQLFPKPAEAIREEVYFPEVWRQTLPCVWSKLLFKPFNRRLVYTSEEVPGLLPLSLPSTPDRQGLELVAEEGGTPVYVDLFDQHKHLLVLGFTGTGKSLLVGSILTLARAHRFPIFVMDYPRSDGESTFGDFARFLGGSYFDIAREAINFCEPLDLEQFSDLAPSAIEEKVTLYHDLIVNILMTLVCDRSTDALLAVRCRAIFQLGLTAYYEDGEMRDRARQAHQNGLGSPEWETMPTLLDLLPFFSIDKLQLAEIDGGTRSALSLIDLKLRSCLSSTLGRAISRPSTLRTDTGLTVYALTNVDDSVDAAVLALSAYSSALRASLSHPNSIWFIDESPILFQFPAIPKSVARLTANGRKAGIRVILAAQDPDTIASTDVSSQIYQNLSVRLTGKITAQAIDSYREILRYPAEAISPNANPSFNPKGQLYRRWLLDYDGQLLQCRFYIAHALLALLANNPKESQLRAEFLARHPDNTYRALAEFARYLTASIQGTTQGELDREFHLETVTAAGDRRLPADSPAG